MPKLSFSYTFDEEIDRIYECFTDAQLNTGIAFYKLVSKLKFIKGERFDEENAEFSFFWKNYYEIKMIVQNVKKDTNYRTYMYRTLYIDKISTLTITIKFSFYWDTIEHKTLFLLDVEYQDEFFGDLIKNEISNDDIIIISENIVKYVNSITKGLEINDSFLINAPFEQIWKTISNLAIFFSISGKKLIPIFEETEVNLNSILRFYDSNDKQLNPTILTHMIVDTLYVTATEIKLSLVTTKRLYIACHIITFIIKKLDNKNNMFFVSVRILEPVSHKIFLSVKKFWKNIMNNYYNYFEPKKNKKTKKNKELNK